MLAMPPPPHRPETGPRSLTRHLPDITEAIAAYRKVLALAPDDADAYSNLGIALQAQGQLAEAIATFKKALALAPDNADAHSNLSSADIATATPF